MPQQMQQGWGQATAAMKQLFAQGLGMSTARATGSRRRSRSSKRAAGKKRSKRARSSYKRSSSSARKVLKKGSAAAKAWGRKMARLRKRA